MLRAALAAFLAISHGFAPSAPAPRFRTHARGLGARAPPPRAAPSDVDREKAGDRSALGLLRFLDLNDDGVLDRKDGQVAAVSLAIAAASLSNPTPALAKGSGGHSGGGGGHYTSSRTYSPSGGGASSSRRRASSSRRRSYYSPSYSSYYSARGGASPAAGRARLVDDDRTWATGVATLRGDGGARFTQQLRVGDVVTLRGADGAGGDVRATVLELTDDCTARVRVDTRLLPREAKELSAYEVNAPEDDVADGSLVVGFSLGFLAADALGLLGEGSDSEGTGSAEKRRERATREARADFEQATERWELERSRLRSPAEAPGAAAKVGGTFTGVASDGEDVRVKLFFEKGGVLSGRGRDSDGGYVVADGLWGASGAIAWRERYDWGEVLVRGRVTRWSGDGARAERIEVRFASSVGVHGEIKLKLNPMFNNC